MPDDMQESTNPSAELAAALSALAGAETLPALGAAAIEVAQVGFETSLGRPARVTAHAAGLASYEGLVTEFTAVDHLGFELRLALSETESHLLAVLVPLPVAGALFGLETSAEQLDDATFAVAQIGAISERTRELLDLVSLSLFTDGLSGAELTISEIRRGQPDFTMGMLQDVSQGAEPIRIDVTLEVVEGEPLVATLVLPSSLVGRLAEEHAALSSGDESPAAPAAPPVMPPNPVAEPEAARGNISIFPGTDGVDPLASLNVGAGDPVHPVRFPPLGPSETGSGARPIDLIMDVSMRVSVELGRSTLTVEEVLELGPGSVVELNKLAGEPVDILVNDRLIARGEVVVVDENFGVRITEIISPRQRVNAMGR